MVLTGDPTTGRLGTPPSQKWYFFILTVCITFIIIIVVINRHLLFPSELGFLLAWRNTPLPRLESIFSVCSSRRSAGREGPVGTGRLKEVKAEAGF